MQVVKILVTSFVLQLACFIAPQASSVAFAQNQCVFKQSDRNHVYLLAKPDSRRLAGNPSPKILVIPFVNMDEKIRNLTPEEKESYSVATQIIAKLSKNRTKPTFTFAETVFSDLTSAEFGSMIIFFHSDSGEMNDKRSASGFVRRNLIRLDSKFNYSNFDGVFFQGFTQSTFGRIDAAYLQSEDNQPNTDYFQSELRKKISAPFETNDGKVWNAVLMNQLAGNTTIAHEMMHLYGLPDLYGSGSGPGEYSMMAGGSSNLFNIEKLTLDWFDTNLVKCLDFERDIKQKSGFIQIALPFTESDNLLIYQIDQFSAFVIETFVDADKKYLWLYNFDTNLRPPLTVYNTKDATFLKPPNLNKTESIGNLIVSSDFHLLVSDITTKEVVLNLMPAKLEGTKEYLSLIAESQANRLKASSNVALQELLSKARNSAVVPTSEQVKPSQISTTIKTTITCVKGKLIKKVTSVNPKCPAGFKRK